MEKITNNMTAGQPTNPDLQCQLIPDGLKTLAELIADPLAQEALDVPHSLSVAAALDLLVRLQKSLRQYIERRGDLFYVGFTGHFSAGKSSTINSLLSAWNTPDARTVDLNPTDTDITLITRSGNVSSLLGVIREGRVAIRARSIESDYLKHLVIADTPGTGDPMEVQEIARQFLPLCDLVIFFFSAASPFDVTDLPLLKELRTRLPFIPLRFVITRADEFRLDRALPLDAANLDVPRVSTFLAQVRTRLTAVMGSGTGLDAEEFFFVDNPSAFGVERLRTFIAKAADVENIDGRLQMHSHKIQFFRTSAQECHAILVQRLKEQFEDIATIIATARRNEKKFQDCARLSSLTITKRWGEELQLITAARNEELTRIPSLTPLPAKTSHMQSVLNAKARFLESIRGDALAMVSRLTRDVGSEATVQADLLMATIQTQIADIKVRDLSSASLRINRPVTVPLRFLGSDLALFSLDASITSVRQSVTLGFSDAEKIIRSGAQSLTRLLTAGSLANALAAAVGTTHRELLSELNRYFEFTEIYHAGVFARNAKEAISRAGLGRRLDGLEHEMSPEQRGIIRDEARDALLSRISVADSKLRSEIASIAPNIEDLSATIDSLRKANRSVQGPTIGAGGPWDTRRNALEGEMAQTILDSISVFANQVEVAIGNEVVEASKRFEDAERDLKIARSGYYRVLRWTGAGIGLFTACLYLYYSKPVESVVGTALLLNIVGGVLGNYCGLIIAKLTDRFPKSVGRLAAEHSVTLQMKCRTASDGVRKSFSKPVLREQEIVGQLVALASAHLEAEIEKDEKDVNSQDLAALTSMRSGYEMLRNRYVSAAGSALAEAVGDLGHPSVTNAKLEEIATKIRNQEILPSFDLLDETERRYRQVQDSLSEIRFA